MFGVVLPSPDFNTPPNVTGEAFGVGHKGAHVGMARDSGPMPGKDPSAVVVLLALPHNSHTGSLESKVKPSDSAE